jgi:glutamate synthase (NADPH/NADH) small chain
MRRSGVEFVTAADIGRNIDPDQLRSEFDALLLATGATRPRDLEIPGRELDGIHFAMDFLTANTQTLLAGQRTGNYIDAKDKDVIVIGGGDTGADCIGTALRHGCRSLVNFELLDQPPDDRAANNPWPTWPKIMRTDYAHEEAIARDGADPRSFAILSERFNGTDEGRVASVSAKRIRWSLTSSRPEMKKIRNSEQTFEANLVLLAMGFLGPESYLADKLGIALDPRSNYLAEHGRFATSQAGVFAAGDCRRGQSLVVWAINEGRGAARSIDLHLRGASMLPAPKLTLGLALR